VRKSAEALLTVLTLQIASRNLVFARNGNPDSAAYARANKYSMLPPMFQYMTSVDRHIIPKQKKNTANYFDAWLKASITTNNNGPGIGVIVLNF
jgi:hypothetical protein